jgi:hypothetical protein
MKSTTLFTLPERARLLRPVLDEDVQNAKKVRMIGDNVYSEEDNLGRYDEAAEDRTDEEVAIGRGRDRHRRPKR